MNNVGLHVYSGILHLLREAKNGDVVENVAVVLRVFEDFLNTRPSLLRLHCRGRCVVIADLKKNWTDSLTISVTISLTLSEKITVTASSATVLPWVQCAAVTMCLL